MTENQKKVNEVFNKMEGRLTYLYGRWQDEREYEDFGEYQKRVQDKFTELEVQFVKMTKRPFAAYFTLPRVPHKLFSLVVTANEYKCMVKNI